MSIPNPVVVMANGGVINSAALETIPGLSYVVVPGTYLLKCYLWAVGVTGLVAKPGIALSSSATGNIIVTVQNIDDATGQENLILFDTETVYQAIRYFGGQANGLIIEGLLEVEKSGLLEIQLNTDSDDCTIYGSSNLILYKIA